MWLYVGMTGFFFEYQIPALSENTAEREKSSAHRYRIQCVDLFALHHYHPELTVTFVIRFMAALRHGIIY